LDYINTRINPLLSNSHKPLLFSICGTPNGIKNVRENSQFEVLCALELEDIKYNHYDIANGTFNSIEKERIQRLNQQLGTNRFDLGLLVSFHHATPNNTMPFIWKDGFKYISDGKESSWFALLPRSF